MVWRLDQSTAPLNKPVLVVVRGEGGAFLPYLSVGTRTERGWYTIDTESWGVIDADILAWKLAPPFTQVLKHYRL